ncbi:cardiomyopathy-associated protein 5 [Salarias fasciatus]|uniref:cardiomyopathy-associated protein 5 n=1 Tax=Salarias fasciatus TaxID=181472 RepID=UPI0011770B1B|nr:cardiomyopathy-associated protein 5-like [Salarias fasciatus]
MEECESLDSEMRELQEIHSEASDITSQDDEDEVEELQNSLREVVQDPSVKPRLQCLMVDPSFSMVTVQSEDSGIVWETASSRCSTPWASETSSTSEGYGMEGPGAAGKITIVFDEEKIVRRRTRSGGRSSRLGDRLSRPGSSRSASVLGIERPEMAEVSLPNIKQELNKTEPDLEEIKNKDQQLFSLISEGYEILNIRVPSKLPTVDEEENTELQDNLSYLDQTPQIKSRNHFDWTQQQADVLTEERDDRNEPSKQEEETQSALTPTPKDSTGDIDYFEKFTLLDEAVPAEQAPEQQEEAEKPAGKPTEEEQKPVKEAATDSPSASEESFVFVTDVEIVGEHLDEVFYGEGPPADVLHQHAAEDEARRTRRESQRSTKESGSVLFGSEQTILTPIFISPGPPKIIDPILLEEPTAMSFMYSDLYEDAMGERKRSDEEHSGAESVVTVRSYTRRSSDEAPDGYLEKFTLKDETPTVDIQSEPEEERTDCRMMWSQSKFEMTGCLIRVETQDEKEKTEEPKTQEGSAGGKGEEKKETFGETEKEIIQVPEVVEEQAATEASEDISEECKPTEKKTGDQHVKEEGKTDQTDSPEDRTEQPEVHLEEGTAEDRKEMEGHQEERKEKDAETEAATEELQTSAIVEERAVKEESEDKTEECKPTEERMESQQVTAEVKTEQPEPSEYSTEKPEVHQEECIDDGKAREDHQEEKKETDAETENATDMLHVSTVTEKQAVKEASEDTAVECRQMEEKKMEDQQVTVETDQSEPPGDSTEKPEVHQEESITEDRKEREDHQEEKEIICEESNAGQHCKSENKAQMLIEVPDQAAVAPVSTEFPPVVTKSGTEAVLTERISTEEASPDAKMVAVDGQLETDIKEDILSEVKEPESDEQEALSSAEPPVADVDSSPETSSTCKGEKAVEVVPEAVAPVEVITDSDSAVHTVVEVTEKAMNETETQTQVQIDLQEVMSAEKTDAQKELPEREQVHESLTEETAAEKLISEDVSTLQDVEVKAEISSEITTPEVVTTQSEKKQQEIVETEQQHREMTEEGSDQTILMTGDKSEQLAEDTGSYVQDIVNVGDELIVFVPKGQAVEMDVEISQWTEKAAEDTPTEAESTPERQAPTEETKTEPQEETEPEISVMEDLPRNDLDSVCQQQEPVEEPMAEQEELGPDCSEDTVVMSPMRSFTPLEDLSELHAEDIQSEHAEAEQKSERHKTEDEPETVITCEDIAPDVDLHREDAEEKTEQEEVVAEAPDVTVDELEYEVITEQDAKEMHEAEAQRDAGEPKPETVPKQEEEVDVEKEEAIDAFSEEELIEADYEIIDAEEENQARLAAELQGMDWFCVTCGCLLSEEDYRSAEHQQHKVNSVDRAYEEIKETLSGWISELQGRTENIEDLVSELELAYNSVEDQCVESEAAMQAQNEEMMALVMEQYNNMSISMEEEKKAKLEQLYDQIVSFQESIDSAKTTLETTSREAETDARSPEDIQERLKAALDSALSLELGPKGLLVFEDYAKANTSSSNLTQRKGIPVPQRPTLQPQEPGSATSTSVTVYWKVNPGDIIDCFQVYCMEDPHGAISEEYRVTVKESYCVLEELDPDKMYKVWVMAVNYTGCSLPSDRLVFKTAPSVPAIDTERCTVLWDSATLRWSSPNQTAGQTYTLEYCRQYELEGEGLRSISEIKVCEQKVLLQPNENYLFYIKAVNEAGVSEQSEAALISTKGTRFHLLKASAHPALELSEDQTAVVYSQDARKAAAAASDKLCPSVLGDLLPARGLYYWETTVSGCAAYRLGVSYSAASRSSSLGENGLSWCLQCIPSPSGCRYQLLHSDIQSSVFVTETPERVGTLLDYQLGRLSFYNAQSGQLLGAFAQSFTQPCHPALGLELPGSLGVSMVLEVPEFTRDS